MQPTGDFPMTTTYLLTVAWMWAIAAVSPGPNFLTIAQIAASRSRAVAAFAVCGTGLATIIWGVCGVAGVQAIFLAAPWAYLALKLAGAAYLVYSGSRMVVQSWKRTSDIGSPPDRTSQMSWRRAFAIGLATGLANPRSALSVASIFAIAMPAQPTLGIAVATVAAMVAVSLAWYFLVAYIFTTQPMLRSYRQIGHWIDRLAGSLLILLGVKLAVESK
jgi:threonine/homoserine/homoserine lactone efflux protein